MTFYQHQESSFNKRKALKKRILYANTLHKCKQESEEKATYEPFRKTLFYDSNGFTNLDHMVDYGESRHWSEKEHIIEREERFPKDLPNDIYKHRLSDMERTSMAYQAHRSLRGSTLGNSGARDLSMLIHSDSTPCNIGPGAYDYDGYNLSKPTKNPITSSIHHVKYSKKTGKSNLLTKNRPDFIVSSKCMQPIDKQELHQNIIQMRPHTTTMTNRSNNSNFGSPSSSKSKKKSIIIKEEINEIPQVELNLKLPNFLRGKRII